MQGHIIDYGGKFSKSDCRSYVEAEVLVVLSVMNGRIVRLNEI